MNGNNFLAQYEKSHHVKGEEIVQGVVVNGKGEEVCLHDGTWYTDAQWAVEVKKRGEWLDAFEEKRQAVKDKAQKEYDAADASFRALQARRDGSADTDFEAYQAYLRQWNATPGDVPKSLVQVAVETVFVIVCFAALGLLLVTVIG